MNHQFFDNNVDTINQNVKEDFVLNIGNDSESSIDIMQRIIAYQNLHKLNFENVVNQESFKSEFDKKEFQLNGFDSKEDPCILKNFKQTVMTSTSVILNQPEPITQSEIPLGFMYTPFYHPLTSVLSLKYPVPQCTKCKSYINCYSKIIDNTKLVNTLKTSSNNTRSDFEWKCSICNHINGIDDGRSGVRTLNEIKQGLGWWSTEYYKSTLASDTYEFKVRKHRDTDISNGVDRVSDGISQLNIDDNIEMLDEEIEKLEKEREYMKENGLYSSPVYFFLVDENLHVEDLKKVYESIEKLVNQLYSVDKKPFMLGLISFSKNMSLYQMKLNKATKNGDSGTSTPIDFNLAKVMSEQEYTKIRQDISRKSKIYLELVNTQLDREPCRVLSVLKSLIETSENCCENLDLKGGFENFQEKEEYQRKPTLLGASLECAIRLANKPRSRIFVYMAGAPTCGLGSVPEEFASHDRSEYHSQMENAYQYYKGLVEDRVQRVDGLAVDFFFFGYQEFHCKVLTPVTMYNGFMTYFIDSHSTQEGGKDISEMVYLNMYNAIRKQSGKSAVVAFYHPDYIELTHLIGSARKVYPWEKFAEDSDYCNTVALGSLEQDTSMSILYQLASFIPASSEGWVTFQFVTILVDRNEDMIYRVVTKRIEVTGSMEKFLAHLDLDVVSFLISKSIIMESLKSVTFSQPPTEIQQKLDKKLQKVVMGTSEIKKSWFSTKVNSPAPIQSLIKKIHSIRRGLVFGDIIQNPDDLIIMQCTLMESNYLEAKRFLQPRLLRVMMNSQQQVVFRNIPLDHLAINSGVVLLLDCHQVIYVMIGSHIDQTNEQNQVILKSMYQYIDVLRHDRLPSPFIIKSTERDHNVRWILSILPHSILSPMTERVEIMKDIYPEFSSSDINSSTFKTMDDSLPLIASEMSLYQYDRYIKYEIK
ncbi:hypothetical protein DLAC_06008 [Tieghemostelium lacteum]|uniref:Protein transport protein SEC23 n=1 Tax=Tieghemostelium lacteum TaxID=361077 RepID=A0A151ZH73_TIELA|nr:hypothetical protein DLAC_06008 [Tieghemostelium lacteum]|eukprot:KYQ93338.1 hypothetical protein DLAC_06008 [Tieghemostelium lacteum]